MLGTGELSGDSNHLSGRMFQSPAVQQSASWRTPHRSSTRWWMDATHRIPTMP